MNTVALESDKGGGGASAAIVAICIGVFFMGVGDMLAKHLTASMNPLQIVLVRNSMATPMIVALIVWRLGFGGLVTQTPALHLLRGALILGAAYTFFSGLRTLGLAEATAIGFAAPIFITVLSAVVFRDPVGWRRWVAVVGGFAGVLVIVRPGAETFQPASFYIVGAATFYAFFMLSSRWIREDESMWTLMLYNNLCPLLLAAPMVPFVWTPVGEAQWQLLAGMAVVATLGLTLMAQAFRMAAASVVAPYDYTLLIWASLWGWLIWGELPDEWTWIGAAIIVVAGIYIALREARLAREAASVGGGDIGQQGVHRADG